jgi:hypothetical protein
VTLATPTPLLGSLSRLFRAVLYVLAVEHPACPNKPLLVPAYRRHLDRHPYAHGCVEIREQHPIIIPGVPDPTGLVFDRAFIKDRKGQRSEAGVGVLLDPHADLIICLSEERGLEGPCRLAGAMLNRVQVGGLENARRCANVTIFNHGKAALVSLIDKLVQNL